MANRRVYRHNGATSGRAHAPRLPDWVFLRGQAASGWRAAGLAALAAGQRGDVRNRELSHMAWRRSRHGIPGTGCTEPWSEAFFTETLDEFRPELVHPQELAGLPTSLLDIVHTRRLPHVVVMHDYHPLCPTLKLWDSTRRSAGEWKSARRAACVARAPEDGREIEQITADYRREQMKRRLPRALVAAIQKVKRTGGSAAAVMESERAAAVPDADLFPEKGATSTCGGSARWT